MNSKTPRYIAVLDMLNIGRMTNADGDLMVIDTTTAEHVFLYLAIREEGSEEEGDYGVELEIVGARDNIPQNPVEEDNLAAARRLANGAYSILCSALDIIRENPESEVFAHRALAKASVKYNCEDSEHLTEKVLYSVMQSNDACHEKVELTILTDKLIRRTFDLGDRT